MAEPCKPDLAQSIYERVFRRGWISPPQGREPSVWSPFNVRVAPAFVANAVGWFAGKVGVLLGNIASKNQYGNATFYQLHVPSRDFGIPCATCGRQNFRLRCVICAAKFCLDFRETTRVWYTLRRLWTADLSTARLMSAMPHSQISLRERIMSLQAPNVRRMCIFRRARQVFTLLS